MTQEWRPTNVIICEDGDASRSAPTAPTCERRAVPAGYMYVDGIVGDIGHGVLRDRRVLSEEGVVVVIVTVDPERRDRDRPRDRHPGLGLRTRSRGSHRRREAGRAGFDRGGRRRRARPTSTRCGATPAARSAGSSTSAPTPPDRDPGRHGSLTAYARRGGLEIDLTGRRALVTGGGNGVGAEICHALVAAGAFVWVNDIYEDRAAKVAADLGGESTRAR